MTNEFAELRRLTLWDLLGLLRWKGGLCIAGTTPTSWQLNCQVSFESHYARCLSVFTTVFQPLKSKICSSHIVEILKSLYRFYIQNQLRVLKQCIAHSNLKQDPWVSKVWEDSAPYKTAKLQSKLQCVIEHLNAE